MLRNTASFLPARGFAQCVALFAGALLTVTASVQAETVSPPLTITTFAGTAGQRQATNGTGTAARFYGPGAIVLDASGNLIVADTENNLMRKITPSGVVTTLAGSAMDPQSHPINQGFADGTGDAASFHMGEFSSTGSFDEPSNQTIGANTMGIDATGNVYLPDTANSTIRKITPAGVVTTFAGAAQQTGETDGTGSGARFFIPSGTAVDAAGNVYVADTGNHTIRKITPAGVVTTIAGKAKAPGSDDNLTTPTAARFINPSGVTVDSFGNLYVTDTGNHTIRKISASGSVTTLAGSAGQKGTADGSGAQARFNGPTGIMVDSTGNLYVADTGNSAIRKITPSGTVSTIAGTKGTTGSADGTGTAALLNNPYGVTVDSSGTVYIADSYNNTIRRGIPASTSGSLQISGVPPAKIQVATNSNVTLKISATGTPSPTYQWSKDGVAISGATSATLTLNAVTGANAGNYSVTVSSDVLSYTSAPAKLEVFAAGSLGIPTFVLVTQPTDRAIAAGASTTFTVEASATSGLTYQWYKNGAIIAGATASTYTVSSATADLSGSSYTVTVTDGTTTVTTAAAYLTVTSNTTSVAPTITTQPSSKTATVGDTVTFSAAASGTPTPTLQWQKNGSPLANGATVSGVTTSTLTLTNVTATDAGNYTVVATNVVGSASSSAATLTVNAVQPPPPPGPTAWLSNLSVRTTMATGQSPLIVGLTVTGSKDILVRGAGPTLGALLGMSSGFMVDPKLDLYVAGGTTPILSNDNWDGSLDATMRAQGAFPFPVGSKDAAFVKTMSNGYTVQVPATGPGLFILEAYDTASSTGTARLTNISARNRVGTGDDILIEGFYISGTGTKKLLIRAVGPELGRLGVTGTLADPKLEVYTTSSPPVKIAESDNWDFTAVEATAKSVGAFDLTHGSKDAATIVTLNASAGYTVQVKGADGGTGEAIVEIYEVP